MSGDLGLAPEPGAQARAEAEKASINFELEETRYTIRPGEIPATLAREYRKQTGSTFRADLSMLTSNEGADIDTLQNLVWLARRQAGDKVGLGDIPDFTYEQSASLKFVDDEAEEDLDSPEA